MRQEKTNIWQKNSKFQYFTNSKILGKSEDSLPPPTFYSSQNLKFSQKSIIHAINWSTVISARKKTNIWWEKLKILKFLKIENYIHWLYLPNNLMKN